MSDVTVEVTGIVTTPYVCAQTGPRTDPATGLPKPYKLGLIGGTSSKSTLPYYDKINDRVNAHFGGLTSAPILLASLEFGQIDAFMRMGDWERIFNVLDTAISVFDYAEVDGVAIASNTLHRLAPRLDESLEGRPLIHIGEVTAQAVKQTGIKKVGFMGTRITMEEDFITDYIRNIGVEVVIPSEKDRADINNAIFKEYCVGNFNTANRELLYNITRKMFAEHGIEGMVLGCTELGQALNVSWQKKFIRECTGNPLPNDDRIENAPIVTDFHFFDSEKIHVDALVDFCINGPRKTA